MVRGGRGELGKEGGEMGGKEKRKGNKERKRTVPNVLKKTKFQKTMFLVDFLIHPSKKERKNLEIIE